MNAVLSPLEAAKEQLSIPALWQLLNLPGKPARSCRSPFREDRNPSFSIYDGGRKWKDHATGEGGEKPRLDGDCFRAAACRCLCGGKSNSEFATRSREGSRGKLAALQLIVPSPMTARTGRTQATYPSIPWRTLVRDGSS
jgi:hypothetical protein